MASKIESHLKGLPKNVLTAPDDYYIGIYVTPIGYVWKPGTKKIKNELTPSEYKLFLAYEACLLRDTIVAAIDKQRYRTGARAWVPLSIPYLTWKARKNLSTSIWEATGTLKKHVKVYRKALYIAVGFKHSEFYPNSECRINQVARWMEFGTMNKNGTTRMPARPLFRPITEYLRKSVSRDYKRFCKLIGKKP